MAYDSARGVMVLFAGCCNGNYEVYQDTWEWDGSRWAEVTPLESPVGRESYGMVYHSQRSVILLFGGSADMGPSRNDTWIYRAADCRLFLRHEEGTTYLDFLAGDQAPQFIVGTTALADLKSSGQYPSNECPPPEPETACLECVLSFASPWPGQFHSFWKCSIKRILLIFDSASRNS